MSFFSTKIVLIAVLFLTVLVLGSFVLFSRTNKPTLLPLPVQQMASASPAPSSVPAYRKAPVQPLPSFSPPTVPYEQLTQQQKEQYQTQADEYYQTTQDTILKNYPWYLKLPIQDTYYFVYFDPLTETFIAKLYPQKVFSVSVDKQTADLKKTVIEKINALGSDADKYKTDWKVIPE